MPAAIAIAAFFISLAVISWAESTKDPLSLCIKKCWTTSCINNCGEVVRRSKACGPDAQQ